MADGGRRYRDVPHRLDVLAAGARAGHGRAAHCAGPAAIARAAAPDGEQRFIQSIKTHVASKLFSETRLYGEKFTIERLVATFLGHLLDGFDAAARTDRVVCGRPVVFAGDNADEALAESRLRAAYAMAGLPSVAFAYEPLGAAYWYGRRLQRNETVLVADFGGGTSDFSVLRFQRQGDALRAEPLAHAGVAVAGDTFDYRIIDNVVAPKLGKGMLYRSFDKRLPLPAYIHASFAQWHQLSWLKTPQTLRELRKLAADSERPHELEALIEIIEMDWGFDLYQTVGAVKSALSEDERAPFLFAHDDLRIEAVVERRDFEAWVAADLARIADAMETALAKAGLSDAAIDAVFLTGGTSFVPAVRRLFTDRFGREKLHIGEAFQSVAAGLALLAADRAPLRA